MMSLIADAVKYRCHLFLNIVSSSVVRFSFFFLFLSFHLLFPLFPTVLFCCCLTAWLQSHARAWWRWKIGLWKSCQRSYIGINAFSWKFTCRNYDLFRSSRSLVKFDIYDFVLYVFVPGNNISNLFNLRLKTIDRIE